MKNFDIEKLERKNVYKTPENFFAAMQENVLKQTVHKEIAAPVSKPAGRVIPMKTNWVYAAAAAIAMIFGITFFMNNNSGNEEINIADRNTTVETLAPQTEEITGNAEELIATETEEPQAQITEDLTINKKTNQKAEVNVPQATQIRAFATTEAKPKAKSVKAPAISKEETINQMLTSFTAAELAEASLDSEMDVYLDLFN